MVKILHKFNIKNNTFIKYNKLALKSIVDKFEVINYNISVINKIEIDKSNMLYYDYIKFKILYDKGGLLIDGNIRFIKNIDTFLENDMFLGFIDNQQLGTNIIWCRESKNIYVEKILEIIKENVYSNITDVFKCVFNDFIPDEVDNLLNFKNEVYLYPNRFFYPFNNNYEKEDITKDLKVIIYDLKKLTFKQKLKIKVIRYIGVLRIYLYIRFN